MPPNDQNQYDFIMDPNRNRSSGPAFLQNPKQRNIVLVLFIIVVLFLVIVAFSVFSSLGSNDNEDLVLMSAYQTEIARVSELGLDNSTDLGTRTKIATLNSFINSDLVSNISYLDRNGREVKPQEQAAKRDSSIDTALDEAQKTNTYDDELNDQIETLVSGYASVLREASKSPEGPNKEALLTTAANNIDTYFQN